MAPTPRDAASRAEIVLSLVDDAASRDVWLGESGALNGASPGSVLIESSTLSVDWVRTLAAEAGEHECKFLDAPVTGTKPHAASGELLFLVGGSAGVLQEARPVFSVLGRDVIHRGPMGSCAMMKLVNNFLTGGAPRSGILRRMAERETTNDFTAVLRFSGWPRTSRMPSMLLLIKEFHFRLRLPRCLFLDRQWNQATEAKTSRRSSNRRRSKGKPEGANSETRYDHPVAGNVIVVVELGKVS